MANTPTDEIPQIASETRAETANAASGAAAKATGGQHPAAAAGNAGNVVASLKNKILGLFGRPS